MTIGVTDSAFKGPATVLQLLSALTGTEDVTVQPPNTP